MTDLQKALAVAIGKAALAKHLESCGECWDEDHQCAVGQAHRRTLADLTCVNPPGSGEAER